MGTIVIVKPLAGKKIRMPNSGEILPADRNTKVQLNQYWIRRIEQKDIEIITEEQTQPKPIYKKAKKVFQEKED